jgi:hypothetical protein
MRKVNRLFSSGPRHRAVVVQGEGFADILSVVPPALVEPDHLTLPAGEAPADTLGEDGFRTLIEPLGQVGRIDDEAGVVADAPVPDRVCRRADGGGLEAGLFTLISVRLLKSRLEMASIANNPESAVFGRQRPTPVYRVFHRMVRLFEQEANQKSVVIRMRGSSFRLPSLYDSFETIPLVLLDNAVKYAAPDSDIVVTIDDRLSSTSVSVSSLGPVVSPDEATKIFDKAFRSEGAKKLTASGAGLGLYIAQTVAKANGFTIQYDAFPRTTDAEDGENLFSFTIPCHPTPYSGAGADGRRR